MADHPQALQGAQPDAKFGEPYPANRLFGRVALRDFPARQFPQVWHEARFGSFPNEDPVPPNHDESRPDDLCGSYFAGLYGSQGGKPPAKRGAVAG